MSEPKFHDHLRSKMDEYAHKCYQVSKSFPREDMFGVISQLRRSSLSVILNYIEGFARQNPKIYKNFLDISFGSLKESQYLLEFAFKENLLIENEYKTLMSLGNEIAAMLWPFLKTFDK